MFYNQNLQEWAMRFGEQKIYKRKFLVLNAERVDLMKF